VLVLRSGFAGPPGIARGTMLQYKPSLDSLFRGDSDEYNEGTLDPPLIIDLLYDSEIASSSC